MAVDALLPDDPPVIGPFRIEGRIGQGGMGAVYLGRTPGGSAAAAIKIIRGDLVADQRLRARFRREVAIARKIRSQVTALVLDADPDGDPAWVAFEYVDGPTLHQLVEGGALRTSVKVGILAGIAEALVTLHDAGLTHRDLKPSNVLVAHDGVKVIDFGIAASIDATRLTSSNDILGTPAWLSPEQIRGEPVGIESDVFSWGLLAAYVTTGRHPFGLDIPDRGIMYRAANLEPDLAGVPPEVMAATRRALAKDPANRPDAHELVRLMLPSGASGETTVPLHTAATARLAAAPSPTDRWRPGRWRLAGGAVVVALVGAGLAVELSRNGGGGTHPRATPATLATYVDPTTGFVISRPAAWRVSRTGPQTFFSDPSSGAYFLVEYRSPGGGSAIQTWQRDEPVVAGRDHGYHRVVIAGDDVAATWEYTYLAGSVEHHVLDYGVVVRRGAYGFSFASETNEADWSSYAGTFASMRVSFIAPSQ